MSDAVPDRVALRCSGKGLTYRDLEDRSNRLAHWFLARGVQPHQHVGLYLSNCFEYMEGTLAAYKIRAVPINVNYRYVADELRYLFNDADLVGVLVQPEYSERLAEVQPDTPKLQWSLTTGEDYEAALAASSPARDFGPRSGDDHYILYTGGTTGMPKGVLWRQDDAFFACMAGADPARQYPEAQSVEDVVSRIQPEQTTTFLAMAPLMHAAGGWTVMLNLLAGNRAVLWPGSLDPPEIWRAIEREKITGTSAVGDAVMRPLLDAWDGLDPKPDISSMRTFSTGGAPLSPALRERFLATFPIIPLSDGYGSSETGIQASRVFLGPTGNKPEPRLTSNKADLAVVLDEETHEPVPPGSGRIGRVARTGRIPLGYYNDPVKTAATFVEWDGKRWSLTGDMATVDDDGGIVLLGRGSICINTGGEKVFPEEVEAALRTSDDVYDVLVVGAPDDRWGERVVAIVEATPGASLTEDSLRSLCRERLAGYKVPKQVIFVDHIVRSPSGKADYRWAADIAAKS